jgi:D-inositol-3-phosphate glycosyltransferase
VTERALRLAVVGPFQPFRGGIAQFNDRLTTELSDRGHEVHRFTFSRQYPERLFPGTSQYDATLPETARPVIDSMNPLSWRKAARAIRESTPSAVVTAYWTPHLAPALAGTLLRLQAPSIGLVHNARPHDGFPFSKMLTRRFLGAVAGVMTLSENVARTVEGLDFKGPIRVSPHPAYDHLGSPVDRAQARKRLDIPADAEVLMCFGLIRPYKGFDLAVRAMEELAITHPRSVLVIAGEAYGSDLDHLIEEVALGRRVRRFPDYIPNSDVKLFFSAADLLLLPYRRASQSGVLATASRFQVPCVASDAGGLADQVRAFDSGVIAEAGNIRALSQAIDAALTPARYPELVAGARRMADALGWGGFAETLENLVDELI